MPGTLFILPDNFGVEQNLKKIGRKLKRKFKKELEVQTSKSFVQDKSKNKFPKLSSTILETDEEVNRSSTGRGDNYDATVDPTHPAFTACTDCRTNKKKNCVVRNEGRDGLIEFNGVQISRSLRIGKNGFNSNGKNSSKNLKVHGCQKKCGLNTNVVDDESKSCLPSESDYVALDCEFVGVGERKTSALARCSIVDYRGHILLDVYVRPEDLITDYRTRWSGICKHDMIRAIPFEAAKSQVKKIIKGKIVIGHAVYNDFHVLGCAHPRHRIRDTSLYRPFRRQAGGAMSLKNLAQLLLGRTIQTGGHSSVDDARASLDLFKLVRRKWELKISRRKSPIGQNSDQPQAVNSNTENWLDDQYWPADIIDVSH